MTAPGGALPDPAGALRLAELTWEQVRALPAARLAVLPVGSCEQHGPHMTLATDAAVAEALAVRITAALDGLAVCCPTLPYGLSEHHEPFAAVSLTPTAFIDAVLALVASLRRQGFPRVLVVNGHGGNVDALRLVVRRAHRELDTPVASLMWTQLASDVALEHALGPSWGHACEVETSLALAVAPHCVARDRIRPPQPPPATDPLTAPPGARIDAPVAFDELTADGALGDPTKADVAVGEVIADAVVERAVAFARRFAGDGDAPPSSRGQER